MDILYYNLFKFLYFIREDYGRIKSIYHMIRHLQVSLLGGAAFSTRGASACPGPAIPLLVCIVGFSSLAASCLTCYILITFCYIFSGTSFSASFDFYRLASDSTSNGFFSINGASSFSSSIKTSSFFSSTVCSTLF